MASADDWTLIESDPGVFTELIGGFGVLGVRVEELYTLDFEQLDDFKPVDGLIVVFNECPGEEHGGKLVENSKDVYFARHELDNACATQAIVNLLLNLDRSKVTLGPILENFRAFSKNFDSENRGTCLSRLTSVRTVHNSFARANVLEIYKPEVAEAPKAGEKPKTGKGDTFHFITYVPIGGRVYELDGLKPAPIDLGTIPDGKEWLDVVREELSTRIEKHVTSDITFNLMAVVANRKLLLEGQLKELNESGMETDDKATEANRLKLLIAEEEEKFARYRNENARRRHNYTPFIVELLKLLAKEGKLVPLVEKAAEEEEKRASAKKDTVG